jgi:hypothetical protein
VHHRVHARDGALHVRRCRDVALHRLQRAAAGGGGGAASLGFRLSEEVAEALQVEHAHQPVSSRAAQLVDEVHAEKTGAAKHYHGGQVGWHRLACTSGRRGECDS